MAADDADVVVVGGGGTGLMAAYTAARLGRCVTVLEKAGRLGGTTAMSVGTICTTATEHQKALGIIDCPDAHFEDMDKFVGPLANRDNLYLRRLLVDNVPDTFQVLVDLGIEFVGPIPEAPHRYPRLHAIVPHARGYIYHLAAACQGLGVRIQVRAPAERLVMESGRVVGVEFSSGDGKHRSVRARNAVILASGDFSSAARPFKERFMSGPLLQIEGINPLSTGDGQRLGEEAGGEIINGDLAWGPEIRFVAPKRTRLVARLPPWRALAKSISAAMRSLPNSILRPFLMSYVTTYLAPSHTLFHEGAVLVNLDGRRFCDERARPQDRIGEQREQLAFIVLDQEVAAKFRAWPHYVSTAPGVGYAYLADYERSRRDIFSKAKDWTGLAQKLHIPADALVETIAQYNREAEALGRAPLLRPPFIALGPAKSWVVFSEGGLRVDERLRVLHRSGRAIPGLYAAGSAGQGGLLLEGHGHHLAWAFTSGRLAGRNAAFDPKSGS